MRNLLRDRAGGDEIELILTHPRHEQTRRDLGALIVDLRRCQIPADLYEFQEHLFNVLLAVDQEWGAVRRVVKRLRKRGGTVPADAPELGTGLNPADLESWIIEEETFERIWRQLKTIGDALAWRAFGFDRRIIVALSRNASPGPLSNKDGVTAEREFIRRIWRETREFALHHDITSAIRISDVTVFHHDGAATLHEIKTNKRRRVARQDQLRNDTSAVLADGGVLPSGLTPVTTSLPFATHLDGLRQLLDLAHSRTGIQGGVVSPGRAVVAASLFAAKDHYDAASFNNKLETELSRYRRRLAIAPTDEALTQASLDAAARWATRPPWAIYPIAPEVAASLTADAMLFCVTMSPAAVLNHLADAGVDAEWLQLPGNLRETDGPVLSVSARSKNRQTFSSLNMEAVAGLMFELVDLKTWSRQIALMLNGEQPTGSTPWPFFADEHRVWA